MAVATLNIQASELPTLSNRAVHQGVSHHLCEVMVFQTKQFARPLGQRRERSWVYLAFLEPIAMTIRILPGTFCLEPCPVRRTQATHQVTHN